MFKDALASSSKLKKLAQPDSVDAVGKKKMILLIFFKKQKQITFKKLRHFDKHLKMLKQKIKEIL